MSDAELRYRDALDIVRGCACLSAHAAESLTGSVHAYEEHAQAIIAGELARAAKLLESCPPPERNRISRADQSPSPRRRRALFMPSDTLGTFSTSPGHAQKAHLSRPGKGANKPR